MNNEDKILQMLESIQNGQKEHTQILEKMNSRLENLETDVKYLKVSQDEQNKLLNALIDRTDIHNVEITKLSNSMESVKTEEVLNKLGSIENKVDVLTGDLNTVEHITAKNYADIVRLKAK